MSVFRVPFRIRRRRPFIYSVTAGSPPTPPAEDTIELQVSYSADDAHEDPTTAVELTSLSLTVASDAHYAGMRFRNVTIPNAATILNAVLTVYINNWSYDSPASMTFHGEDADSAAIFTTGAASISGRSLTTAYGTWDGTNLGTGDKDISVTDAVQEVVNRAGWASGNNMALIGVGLGPSDVRWRSYDGSSTNAARLVITYTSAGATTGIHSKLSWPRLASKVGGGLVR